MQDFPREKLKELVEQQGSMLGEDAERCEFFLRNACGSEYKREVFVLVNAVKEGIPKELAYPPQALPLDVVSDYLSQRLVDNLWLDRVASEWAVQTWAIALGLVTDEETVESPTPPLINNNVDTTDIAEKHFKQLSALNPLDYFRLLWWMLVVPKRLQTYRDVFGKKDDVQVGNWLISSLIWWPLLALTLALSLGMLPYIEKMWLPDAFWLLSGSIFFCWLLTGWLNTSRDMLVVVMVLLSGIVAGIVGGVIAVHIAVNLTTGVIIGATICLIIIMTNFMAVIIANDIAIIVAGGVAVGATVGSAVGIGVSTAGFVEGFVAGGIVGFTTGFIVDFVADVVGNNIEYSLETGKPYWLARISFVLLMTICLVVISLFAYQWFGQFLNLGIFN
ncbi:hypothetical protein QUF74_15460 [Candidatus Halobeggiatoa sp. HSG11]|nr:hypothetical protein [Candidatus Halobeggiatoa sp. HSG11]